MKRIVSGVLRIVMAFLFVLTWYNTFSGLKTFENFHALSTPKKTALFTLILVIANFSIYIIINAVMDFKNRPIRLKPMYIIFFLTVLVVALTIFPTGKVSNVALLGLIIFSIILAYFLINDFIQLWFKRPKKVSNLNSN